jgi:hypothetical protein
MPYPPGPPRLQYVRAIRGLNIWATSGVDDHNSARVNQDGSLRLMWPGYCPASYSFTVASYPANTNVSLNLMLTPSIATNASPEWEEANCIWMRLTTDSGGAANWTFKWKTNYQSGYNYTTAAALTAPAAVGTWTLAFDNNTNVTMTAPNGASTNFSMGVNPSLPDISPAFDGPGSLYLGVMTEGPNASGWSTVLSQSSVVLAGVTVVSNNWLSDMVPLTPAWVLMGSLFLVPTNNCWWVNWTLPDTGFTLQTTPLLGGRSTGPFTFTNSYTVWSTNGLPAANVLGAMKRVLIKPDTFPVTNMWFYGLTKPSS